MKVLLTGGTGFVGRQILHSLTASGVHVRMVVRKGSKDLSVISGMENIDRPIETTDLFAETEQWWTEVCDGIDIIIHCAWYAAPGKYLQADENVDCLIGTLNLAKACVKAGVKKFVGIGTCFEYDLTKGYLSTETPLKPLTLYAAAKVSAYMVLSQYFSNKTTVFSWCRLFYLYGKGEDSRRLVPYIHAQLAAGKPVELTSGAQIRDFLDVEDAAEQIVKVSLGGEDGPVNICSGQAITVRQLAEQIAEEYGRPELLKFGSRPDNLVDPPCVVGVD